MAPRAYWKGFLRLSLVTCPIMIGGRFASLVVVPPQVAIVGAGRIAPLVVAHQGRPAVRRVLPLSLTFDHRVVTGGEAARFIVALRSDLERTS